MFVRTVKRKNRDGSQVGYMQIVVSVREPDSKFPRNKVLFGLGRLDRDADTLRNLANGILRHLEPGDVERARDDLPGGASTDEGDAVHVEDVGGGVRLDGFESRRVGVQLLLWSLWKKLKIPEFFLERYPQRGRELSERVFLIVLNRTLDPLSKNALPGWAAREIWCDNAGDLTAEHFYDALDVVADHDEDLQRLALEGMAGLTGDSLAVALYDTTSAAFEMAEDDVAIARREEEWKAWESAEDPHAPKPAVRRPQVVNDPPARMRGYSRDHRPDLPQVAIGMATTEAGLPIRSWLFPGNTADGSTVIQVQQDLAATGVGEAVFVGDRGMMSSLNLDFLESEGKRYIVGRKLRDRAKEIEQLLATAGPMQVIDPDREVIELADPRHPGRRLILVRHRGRAAHDARVRKDLVAAATARADRVNASTTPHPRDACELETRRGLARLLTKDEDGSMHLNEGALTREARLDGIMVLTTNTDWDAARVVAAYQGLLRTEDGWRTMKTTESLRPIHHRRADRVRAHVTCCTLGLGMIRVVEGLTGLTWGQVVNELSTIHRVTFQVADRQHAVVTRTTPGQHRIYEKVGAPLPQLVVRRGWAM